MKSVTYESPVIDRTTGALLVLVWAACTLQAAIVWVPWAFSGWEVVVMVATVAEWGCALWAMLRSREPLLRKPHWLTVVTLVLAPLLSTMIVFYR